jgi:hypothetical protein
MTIRIHQVALAVSCAILVLTGSAFAQMQPKRDLPKDKPVDLKSEAYRKEIDEKYRETLKAIPDQPQKKVDPWGNVRSSTPSPK